MLNVEENRRVINLQFNSISKEIGVLIESNKQTPNIYTYIQIFTNNNIILILQQSQFFVGIRKNYNHNLHEERKI